MKFRLHSPKSTYQTKKKMFTKKSNGRKDFKSTAISNFMQMDVKILSA